MLLLALRKQACVCTWRFCMDHSLRYLGGKNAECPTKQSCWQFTSAFLVSLPFHPLLPQLLGYSVRLNAPCMLPGDQKEAEPFRCVWMLEVMPLY